MPLVTFRKHWLPFYATLFLGLIAALLPFAFYRIPGFWQVLPFFEFAVVAALWIFGFCYWGTYWQLFPNKIVAHVRTGLFAYGERDIPMPKAEDITAEVIGIIPTIFRFGTLTVPDGSGTKTSLTLAADPIGAKNQITAVELNVLPEPRPAAPLTIGGVPLPD